MDAKKLIPLSTLLLLILAAAFVLGGCSALLPRFPTPVSMESIHTAAAKTVVAQATLSAGETAVAQLTQMASGGLPSPAGPTAIPPTATWMGFTPSATLPPSATQPPSSTPPPTSTLIPPTPIPPTPIPPVYVPPTPVPPPCDAAQFVKDVTVPDGTAFNPGTAFTKTWRLRNIGACAWNASYALVFVSGDRMQTRNVFPMPYLVRPGELVDVSADFIAPTSAGRYRSNWMLSNPYGNTFGIGPGANRPFWVDITVKSSSGPYDFALNMCSADWRTSERGLPCPGNPTSQQGSVVLLENPRLETGKHENEPALWTRPASGQGGQIFGIYPPYRVQSGDHFMSDIGCLWDSPHCNVTFFLEYQISGQPVKSLGSWQEVSDGLIKRVDVDVSGLANQNVQFILRVVNNGKWADANAFWLVPAIRRGSSPPPPPPPPPPPTPTTDWESLPAVQAARIALGMDTGINPARFNLRSVEAVNWNDTCLGIPQPGRVCAPAIVPGYRIVLGYSGQRYEVHTDQNGTVVYWFPL